MSGICGGAKPDMSAVPTELKRVFAHIDENKSQYIQALKDAVAVKSVSAWVETRPDCQNMMTCAGERLQTLGCTVKYRKIGTQTFPTGEVVNLPDVIFAKYGSDPSKTTLLIYGHLDVQPAKIEDGWDTDPFVLTEKDGKLFGRGSTDDKGPIYGWFHAIEAFQKNSIDLPINLKFVFEGMEESGSEGLDDLLISEKDGFLRDVDIVCISDNYWLGKTTPCLTYGLRGLAYFFCEIECADRDLHSGVFGGTVHEAMVDLVNILDKLIDENGTILVPGIMNDVAPLGDKEEEMYQNIDFDLEAYRSEIGVKKIRHPNDKVKTLMSRWRYPSLSIHGIEGAFSDPGAKTVIPRKVIGKFSIRLVPDQDPQAVEVQVKKYIEGLWERRDTPNKLTIRMEHGGKPWMASPKHPNYQAATRAMKTVFGCEPHMTREGGSIPVTLTFQETTGKNVLLLPMGSSDDGAHSQNEKIDVRNYIEGTKVMAAYLWELAQLPKSTF